MKKLILSFFILSLFTLQNIHSQINSVSVSPGTSQTCDSVTVTLAGTHYCPNDSITGISHSVSGSIITINVSMSFGICIPPTNLPPFTATYKFLPATIIPGTYTVRAYYDTQLSTNTGNLTLVSCCPNQADAGNDTSLCDVSSFQLNANAVSGGATASWTILSGGGSLNSSTLHNATLSNLSYGMNTLVWSTSDTSCSTTDTIHIENSELPSAAIVEADRISCEDTTTVKANSISVGTGKWNSLTLGGTFINGSNNPNSLVSFIIPKSYTLTWTVSSGACASNVDTLKITYTVLDSAPVINESNLILTSSAAPQYQWYKDGLAIPGETNQSHTVVSNGKYSVLGSIQGCSSGLFSNEIEILNVGNEEFNLNKNISISPNPVSKNGYIRGLSEGDEISIYQNDLKLIHKGTAKSDAYPLDFSSSNNGIYFVRIQSQNDVVIRKIMVQK